MASSIKCIFNKSHQRLHLVRPRRHLSWNHAQWVHVCFSDETRFKLCFNNGRLRVYHFLQKVFDGTVWEHNHYGGESIIVWTGISAMGRTQIYAIDENLTFQRLNNDILQRIHLSLIQRLGSKKW